MGNGPSLDGFDLNQLRPIFHILAVKGVIFDCPFATAGFGLDFPRYQEWHAKLQEVKIPVYWAAVNFIYIPEPKPECVTFLHRIDTPAGLSDDPRFVHAGGTSGFGAFNVAWLKKARTVVLLGYDYGPDKKGRWHYGEEHYGISRGQDPNLWKHWIAHWETVYPAIVRRGVNVINGSLNSLVTTFPRMTPTDAITYAQKIHACRG